MAASDFSDAFISYRRVDVEWVKLLVEALQGVGKELWVDWEDIPPGSEVFSDDIKRGLQGADAFIAVLTPEYLESTYCVDLELGTAIQLNKKIIPIVLRKFDRHFQKLPETARNINWIYFTPHAGQENSMAEAIPRVLEALEADFAYRNRHKRIFLEAEEWDCKGRPNDLLAVGEEARRLSYWMEDNQDKAPPLTELHHAYILAGLAKQNEREAREKAVQKRIKRMALNSARVQAQMGRDLLNDGQDQLALLLGLESLGLKDDGIYVPESSHLLSGVLLHSIREVGCLVHEPPAETGKAGKNSSKLGGVIWSPDGDRLLSWKGGKWTANHLWIWDASSGEPLSEIQFGEGIDWASWSPDGARISVYSRQTGTLISWDSNSAEELMRVAIAINRRVFKGIAYNADGSIIYIWGNRLHVLDAVTGNQITTGPHPDGMWENEEYVEELKSSGMITPKAYANKIPEHWSPGHHQLLSWQGRTLRVWDARTGEILGTIAQEETISDVAWSPEMDHFLIRTRENISVWDAQTLVQKQQILIKKWPVRGFLVNSDGSLVLGWGLGLEVPDVLQCWNLRTGKESVISPTQGVDVGVRENLQLRIEGAAWRPVDRPGSREFISWAGNLLVGWREQGSGKHAKVRSQFKIKNSEKIAGAAWHPDGKHFLIWGKDTIAIREKEVLDPRVILFEGLLRGSLKYKYLPQILLETRDAVIRYKKVLRIADPQRSHVRQDFSLPGGHAKYLFSRFWTHLLIFFKREKKIRVWDLKEGQPALEVAADLNDDLDICWYPDGKRFLLPVKEKLQVWDLHTKAMFLELPIPSPGFLGYKMDALGDRLIGISAELIWIWDAETGEPLVQFAPPRGFRDPKDVELSPDGVFLLVFGKDTTFELRDARNGEVLHEIAYPFSHWHSAWHLVHGQLCTWGLSRELSAWFHIWDVKTGEQVLESKTTPGPWRTSADGGFSHKIDQNQIRIMSSRTGEVWKSLEHPLTVKGAAFSQDGSRVLSWTEKEVLVWNTESGNLLLNLDIRLKRHKKVDVIHAAWDAEDRNVLVYVEEYVSVSRGRGTDRNLIKWPVEIDGLIALARTLQLRDLTGEERKNFLLA